MEEIWKDILGYENYYMVSNRGRIKSINKKYHILKNIKCTHGYLRVNLYKNKKRKTFKVHRLVASAFLDNLQNYKHVNHIDGNKENNHVNNLEWCNEKQNNEHYLDNNYSIKYHKNIHHKILKDSNNGMSRSELCNKYNRSYSTICYHLSSRYKTP